MSAAPEGRRAAGPRSPFISFSLLLAVAALLFAAVNWYRLRESEEMQAVLQQRVADLQQNAATRDALAADAADTDSSLKAMGQRVDQLDAAFSDLRKHSQEGRDAWIKAEAASLLVAADEDLQLRADPALALKALEQADARLKLLSDPRLIAVRQEIAKESAALRALPRADLEGMTLTLTELAGQVDALPLKRGVPEHYQPGGELGEAPAAAATGFWSRLRSAAARVGSSLFTVRRHGLPVEPLLTPKEEFLLRRNLELRLETARSALLERQGAAFQASVRSAAVWMQDYFDTRDAAVKASLTLLQGMQGQAISPKLPDVSASLTLLRRLELPAGAAP
ncbi:MAG TPA: uroporphyrinogen-III C-methyltransferase [Gammaproteobacteria bacterium]